MKSELRIGGRFLMKSGHTAVITDYRGCNNVDVVFADGTIRTDVTYQNLITGYVSKPGIKGTLLSRGKSASKTRAHAFWSGILTRCYSKLYLSEYPSYTGCSIDPAWRDFECFEKWFNNNYVEGFSLDKDILVKGNKVYSESTCVFIPQRINALLLNGKAKRGKYCLGVSYMHDRKRFVATLQRDGKNKRIGTFKTEIEAFECYKAAKEEYIQKVANEYKEVLDPRIFKILINYKIEITD